MKIATLFYTGEIPEEWRQLKLKSNNNERIYLNEVNATQQAELHMSHQLHYKIKSEIPLISVVTDHDGRSYHGSSMFQSFAVSELGF
jgi:hypothetical protein